jgi:hypothetical protein
LISTLALTTVTTLAGILGSMGLAAGPAQAATTDAETATCVDGGGARWTVRSVWGSEVDAAGGKVVQNDSTGFTTTAAAATTVDYRIAVYDGAGKLFHTLTQEDRSFAFAGGKRYLNRNPRNPPSAPGKVRIVVSVGDGNDGRAGCSVTFLQPGAVGTASATSTSMPTGDLPGWRQTFVDDFTTDAPLGSWLHAYGDRWRAYPEPWRDTSKRGVYAPGRVLSSSNGMLDMYLHAEKGRRYVAAPEPRINGAGRRGQTFGRYAVRFRVPTPIPGYKTAWLLWPDSNRNAEGEIDFPEANLSAGSTIGAYAHDVHGRHSHNAFAADSRRTYADWHTATIEWLPTGVTYWLDGVKLGTAPKKGTPRTSMHWVLQTETALGGAAPRDSVSGHVQVDWVAVWSRS